MFRRHFLAGLGMLALGCGSTGAGGGTPVSPAEKTFPAPDLTDASIRRFVAGIRPSREGAVRLEADVLGQRVLVHSYGYGGGGITLSPGAAQVATELLRERLAPPAVAVLGSGVIGLSTALALQKLGYSVNVYAREFPPNTTSDLAGGLWAPSEVGTGTTPEEQALYHRMVDLSYRAFQSQLSPTTGVYLMPVFLTPGVLAHLNELPPQLRLEPIPAIPFPGQRPSAFQTSSFLIQTSVYLPYLLQQVQERGARIETRTFTSLTDLEALSEDALVNCLGLGAGSLLGDAKVLPIRGQLVIMSPTESPYGLGHDGGYMISRPDQLILGGTFEPGIADATPVEVDCRGILERNRGLFLPG